VIEVVWIDVHPVHVLEKQFVRSCHAQREAPQHLKLGKVIAPISFDGKLTAHPCGYSQTQPFHVITKNRREGKTLKGFGASMTILGIIAIIMPSRWMNLARNDNAALKIKGESVSNDMEFRLHLQDSIVNSLKYIDFTSSS
jgi:hypothetical protein